MRTTITELLGCDLPIVQAPMAGGGDTPALVAAVGNAGGFGFIGAAYSTPEQIDALAQRVRTATVRAFGINLFAPVPLGDTTMAEAARARLAAYYRDLQLELPPAMPPADRFDAQLAAALASDARAISFTFGIPPRAALDAVRARGKALIGTATTVAEGEALRAAGFDAIVAQGSEAGGHRGSFLADFADALIGTMALVPQIADATGLPVLASGGIMDGRGIAAALALGAGGAQLGTAFLTTSESGIVETYKDAIVQAREDATRITRAFSGRPARGLVNRFMEDIDAGPIAPFPIQNALTRPLRTAAARAGRIEWLNLWCGQAPRLARRLGAGELVAQLAAEAHAAIAALPRSAV